MLIPLEVVVLFLRSSIFLRPMTSLTSQMKRTTSRTKELCKRAPCHGIAGRSASADKMQQTLHLTFVFLLVGRCGRKQHCAPAAQKSAMSNKKCNEHLPLTAPLFGHFFILFSRSNLFVQRWSRRQLRLRAAAAATLWWSRKLSQFYFFVTTIHTVTVLVLFHELLQYLFLYIPSFRLAISLRKRLAESRRASRLLVPKNAMSLHAELELSILDEDASVQSTGFLHAADRQFTTPV